jgi:hypothetical protein
MHRDAVIPTFQLSTGTTITQTSPWQTLPVTPGVAGARRDDRPDQGEGGHDPSRQTLRQAEQTMIYPGRSHAVRGERDAVLQGLITSTDLHSERQMSLVHSRHLRFDEDARGRRDVRACRCSTPSRSTACASPP